MFKLYTQKTTKHRQRNEGRSVELESILHPWVRSWYIAMMTILLILVSGCDATPVKIPADFVESAELILKFTWNARNLCSQCNL